MSFDDTWPLGPPSPNQAFTTNAAYAAALCVLYYDHILTLDVEVKHFWRLPLTRGNIMFFLNRYFSFFANIALIAYRYSLNSHTSCDRWQFLHQAAIGTAQMIVTVSLSIRVYALYGRDRRILALLVVACLAGGPLSIYEVLAGKDAAKAHIKSNLEGSTCLSPMFNDQAKYVVTPWYYQFAMDALLFGLTVARTWAFPRKGDGLPQIIRRDGALYFIIMAMAHLANILTFYILPPPIRGCLGSLSSSISVTLASRLHINLQQPAAPTCLSTMPADIGLSSSMISDNIGTLDDMDDCEFKLKNASTFNSDIEHGTMKSYGTAENLLGSQNGGHGFR